MKCINKNHIVDREALYGVSRPRPIHDFIKAVKSFHRALKDCLKVTKGGE